MKKLISLSVALVSVLTVNVASADSAKVLNPANGHSYKRFDSPKTWYQAKDACVSQGMYLATITSKIENDWIFSNFSNDNFYFWLGGNAQTQGNWQWVTNEAWSYQNWLPGQPDNGGSEEALSISTNSQWNNLSGGNLAFYLCEQGGGAAPSIVYSQVISLVDINHNGVADYALLGEKGTFFKLFVYDGGSKKLIRRITVKQKTGYEVKSFTVANDVNGDGVAEIAVLVVKTATNVSTLQLHDPVTGAIVSTLSLPKN